MILRLLEEVAEAAHRADGDARGLQLAAQAGDEFLDRVRRDLVIPAVQCLHELLFGHDAIHPAGQIFHGRPLTSGQIERFIAQPGALAFAIQAQRAQRQEVAVSTLLAANQCPDARFQFRQGYRLDEVVVGAEVEQANTLFDGHAGGHDEHRRLLPSAAQAGQHLAAIEARQSKIEDGQIVAARGKQAVGARTVSSDVHGVAGLAQGPRQAVGQ